jgi:non-ribosomal peptide synthetase component E (peptide arylation enzyme)
VTGFAPSSAIQIPLFYKNEILNPIPVSGRLSLKKPKPTKLTPNQSSQIVERHHSGQSLRELAAEFVVSHETIRTIIKQHQTDRSQEEISKSKQEGESNMLDST